MKTTIVIELETDDTLKDLVYNDEDWQDEEGNKKDNVDDVTQESMKSFHEKLTEFFQDDDWSFRLIEDNEYVPENWEGIEDVPGLKLSIKVNPEK